MEFTVNAAGKETGVLLSMEEFGILLEYLHDLAAIATHQEEGPIPLEEVIWHLERDGLLP